MPKDLKSWLKTVSVYFPKSVREGKRLRPRNLESLLHLFGCEKDLVFIDNLSELNDGDIWCIPVFLGMSHRLEKTPDNFTYYDALCQSEIDALNSSVSGYAVLDMALESLSSNIHVFDKIHRGAKESGISPEKLVIVNCNAQSNVEYHKYCVEQGITRRAKIIPFNYCMWMLIGHSRTPDAQVKRSQILQVSSQKDRLRPKTFLCTNGRLRPHRIAAVLFMQKHDMLNDSLVSLIGYSESGNTDYAVEFETLIQSMPLFSDLSQEIPNFLARMPMTLDTDQIDLQTQKKIVHETLPWSAPSPYLFLDSYFSVVTETILRDSGTVSITEKTFKPIMNLHPFIILGGQGSLRELRQMGFKSFSPFINEEYDSVQDYQQRTNMALEECRRLSKLPRKELHALYVNLLPRLQHNFELFWDKLFLNFEDNILRSIKSEWVI